jgi:hypothetical protein
MKSLHPLAAVLVVVFVALSFWFAGPLRANNFNDPPMDLVVPAVTEGEPAAGQRVKRVHPDYAGTDVYHALYLPTDWKPGKAYPVIVEFAGNQYGSSLGTVDGSSLGYGVSGGEGCIWICMPYVNTQTMRNELTWWGNVDATVAYCIDVVRSTCDQFGGDAANVFIAGFSRGAIACNYIGLHNDQIASLWRGYICHSHYDGVRRWGYDRSDRDSARLRLARLKGRPQFISHENSVEETQDYLNEVCPEGPFTFLALEGIGHTDTWVLRDSAERTALRNWFAQTLAP